MDLAAIEAAIQPDNFHNAATKVICLENTHNNRGGVVVSLEYMESVAELARAHGLPVHLDGARVCNAAAALGVTPARVCRDVDTVNMCFSKGLAAPVGSILAGPAAFIDRARRYRKALGGGMRQVGVLGACAILSIQEMWPRTGEDHVNARVLYEGLSALPFLDVEPVHTNLVFFNVNFDQLADINDGAELI